MHYASPLVGSGSAAWAGTPEMLFCLNKMLKLDGHCHNSSKIYQKGSWWVSENSA